MEEHTQVHIMNIDFGNKMLDQYLKDEDLFWRSLVNSEPLQYVLGEHVYGTLVKLDSLPRWNSDLDMCDMFVEAIKLAQQITTSKDNQFVKRIAKSILAINELAQQRLDT
jgi:hypothetical protein